MTRGLPLSVITLALLTGCHGRDLELCDIAQSDCQQDVYYADLRLRGDGYDPFGGIPPIRTGRALVGRRPAPAASAPLDRGCAEYFHRQSGTEHGCLL